MNNNGFELLLAKDKGDFWQIIGITYSSAMQIEPDCVTLRATLFAIEECKKALAEGKTVTVSKVQEYSEIQPHELIYAEMTELDRCKLMALNEVTARMHKAIFGMNVLDLLDYLDCYINLLNAGYFITDSNREDKYFEVIEASLECEEPLPLDLDNATYEQELQYIEAKKKYDTALHNLSTLERYLNCYDNLQLTKNKIKFFSDTRKKIEEAASIEDVELQMKMYRSNLKNYNMVNMT